MKTISFIGTQMQLVNCGEYISKIGSEDNVLVIATVSSKRKKQLLDFIEYNCYRKLFSDVKVYSLDGNRIQNIILTFWNMIRIWSYLQGNQFDKCVVGYYKQFYGRYAYSILNSKEHPVDFIALDDGAASSAISRQRSEEKELGIPFLFSPNKLIERWYKIFNTTIIPKKITYFSVYQIDCHDDDELINYQYEYLKENVSDFNIPKDILNSEIIFLGEPLYFKNFISYNTYKELILKFSKTCPITPILYYAHPEESYNKWKELEIEYDYKYLENTLSFEVFSAFLPDGCRVVSFVSSVLINIKKIDSRLNAESIYIAPQDLLIPDTLKSIEECYNSFRDNGVRIHNYYE